MIRRPPRSTLFPSPTLFRSLVVRAQHRQAVERQVVQEVDEALLERSEEHTSELQSPCNLVCRLLLEKKKFDGTGVGGCWTTLTGDASHSERCDGSRSHPCIT